MSKRRDIFLSQFDSNFRSYVVEFSKSITEWSKTYDVLIFIARKAACLAGCLEDLRMCSFHCTVISNRVLDFDISWLTGKRVAIIDDALISGTTIDKILDRLSSISTAVVDVHVLSLDRDWWSPALVRPTSSALQLNSEQTAQICSNIVKAISLTPRPYSIDYPLFKGLRLRETDYLDIGNSQEWIVQESTSYAQFHGDVRTYTILPTAETLIRFCKNYGLPDNADIILKIRLFVLKVREQYWCETLPIVIFPPLHKANLKEAFDNLISDTKLEQYKYLFRSCKTDEALKVRLQLIQYFISTKLAIWWFNSFEKSILKSIELNQDHRNIGFLFPPEIASIVAKFSAFGEFKFNTHKLNFSEDKQSIESGVHHSDFDELSAMRELYTPFLNLFKNEELRARRLVKKLGRMVYVNEEFSNVVNRLDRGFSIIDLKTFLQSVGQSIDPLKVIHYFLDVYIDRGAVVPITCCKDDYVFRAYRHGEDVEFSENEIKLCVNMLKSLVDAYGNTSLPHTILEKALVLFVRVGVERGFLELTTKPISEYDKAVGVRFYLHGAVVVGAFDKHIYKYDKNSSLSKILEDSEYIRRTTKTGPYEIVSRPQGGVDCDGTRVANQLGMVLGRLLRGKNRILSVDDLILVASCPYPLDLIGSMAAEVNIFLGFFYNAHRSYFPENNFPDEKLFCNIRKQNAWIALNSGSWKYVSYMDGHPWKCIDDAYNALSASQDTALHGEVWKSFWPETGKESSELVNFPGLKLLIDEIATWLLSVRYYINLCEFSFIKRNSALIRTKAYKEASDILHIVKKYSLPQTDSFQKLFDRVCSGFADGTIKKSELFEYGSKNIHKQFHLGRKLLSEVDAIADCFGKVDNIIRFNHALVLDFKESIISYELLRSIVNDVCNKVRKDAKEAVKPAHLFVIPRQYTAIPTGLWFCSSGGNALEWLFILANEICAEVGERANLKFSFFSDLAEFSITKKVGTTQYYAPLFWDFAKELLRKKHKNYDGSELVAFSSYESAIDLCQKYVEKYFQDFSSIAINREVEISIPYNVSINAIHYNNEKGKQMENQYQIGILTVVPEERKAVVEGLQKFSTVNEISGTLSSRKYAVGKLHDSKMNEVKVVVTRALEQGNRSIIPAYNAMCEEFNPTIIVLLGIAGSIHEKVNIGDVVICSETYYYDRRAETESGSTPRLDPYKINAWTKNYLSSYYNTKGSDEPFVSDDSFSKNKVYNGPLGTGEAVVKFKDADIRSYLLSINDKTYALETEAGGAAQQFYEDELSYSRRSKGIIIIRGISDKADIEKDDNHRNIAAENAMNVLIDIVAANEKPL